MRQLVLYSDQILGKSDRIDDALLSMLAGTPHRIGYVPSESDIKRRYFAKVERHYAELGISKLTYFDLGEEYDQGALQDLLRCDAVHLSGGDVTCFLAAMRRRGFNSILKRYVENGGILVGVSAGAMLMAKTISLCFLFEECKVKLKDHKALGLVDFEFFPHFDGSEKELKSLCAHSLRSSLPIFACDDSEGIVVCQEEVRIIGTPLKIQAGKAVVPE